MRVFGLITFNKDHVADLKEAEDLVLAFINEVNDNLSKCFPIRGSENSKIQEIFKKTKLYEKFIYKDPNDITDRIYNYRLYSNEKETRFDFRVNTKFHKLCDWLDWYCCTPIRILKIADGSSGLFEEYKQDCELGGDRLRIIDLDMDDIEKINISNKIIAHVMFRVDCD